MALTYSGDSEQVTAFDDVVPYASVAAADQYFAFQLDKHAIWDAFTDVQKLQLLQTATQDIDALHYVGERLNYNQAREWPRLLATEGFSDTAEDRLPVGVAKSCCEQAYYRGRLYTTGYDPEARRDHQDQGMTAISRVGANESFDLSTARRHRLCPRAYELVRPWVCKTGNLQDPPFGWWQGGA